VPARVFLIVATAGMLRSGRRAGKRPQCRATRRTGDCPAGTDGLWRRLRELRACRKPSRAIHSKRP